MGSLLFLDSEAILQRNLLESTPFKQETVCIKAMYITTVL